MKIGEELLDGVDEGHFLYTSHKSALMAVAYVQFLFQIPIHINNFHT